MNSLLARNILTKRQLSSIHKNSQINKRFTSNQTNKLTFFLNGRKVELDGSIADPESSLIEYLRDKEGLKGAKLTCGEGGCGACTVTLSQFDKSSNKFVHRAVNSCLVPLYYVEGMAVTTVDGIGNTRTNTLHPVQERLAKTGGSQCGYCTPGFVMSMYTHLRNNPEPKSQDFCKAIDGNLCRCTGYRPIVETVKSFCKDTNSEAYVPHDTSKDPQLPEELKSFKPNSLHIKGPRSVWHAPTTLEELLQLRSEHPHAKIINGSTELGIDLRFKHTKMEHLIAPTYVPELSQIKISDKTIEIGSAVTLTRLYDHLKNVSLGLSPELKHRERTCHAIMDQLHWFAGTQIRNVASIGGNIVNASPISDLNPVWMACGATFKVKSATGERNVPAITFFGKGYKQIDLKPDEVLVSVSVPWNGKNEYIEAYKQSKRREDDIAIVTSALYVKLDDNRKILDAKMSYGGLAANTVMATGTQTFLTGKVFSESTIDEAMNKLKSELGLSGDPPGGMAEYRTSLALSFLYKFYISVMSSIAPNEVPKELQSVSRKLFEPTVPDSKIVFDVPKRGTSVGDSEPHLAAKKQTTGEALYTTDIPRIEREAQGALVTSTKAHALIKSIDASEALKMPGVIGVYDHKSVPGTNMWGDIVHDEEVFASKQPIAIVVAENEHIAKRAAKAVKVEYEDLPNPVFSIEDAIKANSYFPVVRKLADGDIQKGFSESDHTIEGNISIGGQEHFYFEPMVSLAAPEDTDMIIYSSTQNANKTQKFVASALGIPANRVIVKLNRLGGGFGGKETRNIGFSAIAAVASHQCNRPVRLLLERDLDMTITGGRHPFRGEYKVGFTNEGMVKAVDVKVYNNGGFTHDLSYPVLERALLFQDSCYRIPNIRIEGRACKTNMPSHTAFRGFGGPQGHLIAETWMDHMASVLKKPADQIREKNLYNEGDLTYYKFPVTKNVRASWTECKKQSDFENRVKQVEEFNKNNKYRKRGISIMPSKYGVGFTVLFLNQGSALIHCYTDGSVLVTHGGTEMGQGLHTKVAQIVATELDIPVNKVHIRETATDKIPNSSATAASMGSDIYGMAALKAARTIKERLAPIRQQNPGASWKDIVNKAYLNRVDLSAQGFFMSEHKGFNFDTGVGEPWRYFTLGTACTEVEVDTLTGDWKMLRNDLVVDVGQPVNPGIDVGQIEGAFLQGMGWTTIEELAWGDSDHSWVKPQGRLQCAGPGAYKIPSADDVPADWRITLMKDTPHQKYEVIAVQSSKAIGEPPLLLGVSARFALREAIAAARKQEGLDGYFPLDSPLSTERIRMACADKFTRVAVGDKKAADNFKAKGSF